MGHLSNPMKTIIAKAEQTKIYWCVVDVAGKTLGRVATQIASYLRGKNDTNFTPHVLTGPRIVAVNADKIRVTGKKLENKVYDHYTGHVGGLKSERLKTLFARCPERVLEKAVKGMLPKNALGRAAFKRFRVYAGSTHPHLPQNPKILELH